ncbi:unnamed protein product [Zymoseptoria tritici ST99CH_3D7]|uniref:Signal peptide-containing protein n=1 Tax=Zymoseptoria tritici (strain ST99CH_3D7) TaxID=1276538 RepID=A0A1X7S3R8_ZYMT9|nr:unnamed protein product [Zymoseptoria tritici ST99CH_3D7]
MRISPTLSIVALCHLATARISGIAAPSVIAPDSTFNVTILTENYIQSVKDISASFALSSTAADGFLGVEYLGSFYLGPKNSNILTNITLEVTAPSTTNAKFLTAAITSLYGASNGPVTEQFSVPITFGDETSDETTVSRDRSNICSTAAAPASSSASAIGPRATPSCTFPTMTNTLIQLSLVRAEGLINNIIQNDNRTGTQNLGELNGVLGDVTRAVLPSGQSCNNEPTGPWPPLSPADSQARAVQILRDAEGGLNALQGAVLECDKATAVSALCRVLHLVDYLDTYYT